MKKELTLLEREKEATRLTLDNLGVLKFQSC